ncbi:ATP-binding cassette domain-containing protein [Helicobacter muridarum]|uniref:Iron(III) ABC transporter ATP-binding protein n=1 Tax=Helicobacter muridarum TaxID=216 RepID=A0A377PSI6_9HELI|nr:ATP-binding cassette domain-containing protein [Helicobacter muridarum]STQ85372.1 iron(III) ABC transporter ATP-binding protein [Helicobacter muridarum]
MFALHNACFTRKNKEILKNISLSVQEGEVLSILGRNGAGKRL